MQFESAAAADISVIFEMEYDGFREIYGKLTVDWEKVAKNRSIAVGVKSQWLGADIQDTLKELHDETAIEFVFKNADDETTEALNSVFRMVADRLFAPDGDPLCVRPLRTIPTCSVISIEPTS